MSDGGEVEFCDLAIGIGTTIRHNLIGENGNENAEQYKNRTNHCGFVFCEPFSDEPIRRLVRRLAFQGAFLCKISLFSFFKHLSEDTFIRTILWREPPAMGGWTGGT